jgi:phosphoribosylaminoimidazole-succinocarboxamide synthase
VLAYPDPNVVIGKRLDILPVEIVVRGYLAGTTSTSVLTMYKQGKREMYGLRCPTACATTSAAAGDHHADEQGLRRRP